MATVFVYKRKHFYSQNSSITEQVDFRRLIDNQIQLWILDFILAICITLYLVKIEALEPTLI